MRKKEQKLWDRMRSALKTEVYLERIENMVSAGRPDVDAMWEGIVLPIELKAAAEFPKRPSTPVLGREGLNLNQLNWWLNWKRWGGSGLIVVSVGRAVYAIPAEFSDEVNSFTSIRFLDYKVDWAELLEIIKKEITCLQNR